MKAFVANTALAIALVASVLTLIVVHEFLASVADGTSRFVPIRRWLAVSVGVLAVLLGALIVARFYFLRT